MEELCFVQLVHFEFLVENSLVLADDGVQTPTNDFFELVDCHLSQDAV